MAARSPTPLTESEIARVVEAVSALPVDGVAICLLHSYENPSHELRLKDALIDRAPHLSVSCSAEIWPQIREYERALVTVMNAYVRPAMARYLEALEGTLRAAGIAARPYLTRSNGGIMTTTTAKEHPVQTLLSGPASGVIGAVGVARQAGYADVITFDMGGTSADVALITGDEVDVQSRGAGRRLPPLHASGRRLQHRRRWRVDCLDRRRRRAQGRSP